MPFVPPPNIKQPLAQSPGEAAWQRLDLESLLSNFFAIDHHQVMLAGGARYMVPGMFQSSVKCSESIARGLML